MTPAVDELPHEVAELIGVPRFAQVSDIVVEPGYIRSYCSATENANPVFWDPAVADQVAGGPIAPPTMLSVWMRPEHWIPGEREEISALALHYWLKDRFGLSEGVVARSETVFLRPVRVGDVVETHQVLRTVSDHKTTRRGAGRFWSIDVEYSHPSGDRFGLEQYSMFAYDPIDGRERGNEQSPTPREAAVSVSEGATEAAPLGAPGASLSFGQIGEGAQLPVSERPVTSTAIVLGAIGARDWRPMHHDRDFAVQRSGASDIFMSTPAQAGWFERYLADWTGPEGRIGRMRMAMHRSVLPRTTARQAGRVLATRMDDFGCGWVDLELTLSTDGILCTSCRATVALPVDAADHPWRRSGDRWCP